MILPCQTPTESEMEPGSPQFRSLLTPLEEEEEEEPSGLEKELQGIRNGCIF